MVEQADRVAKERGAAHYLRQLRQQAAHVMTLRQGEGHSGVRASGALHNWQTSRAVRP